MTGAPRLRLVTTPPPPPMPPARPRLREVRITALAGRYPYGGVTKSFALSDQSLAALIAFAERLEARSS